MKRSQLDIESVSNTVKINFLSLHRLVINGNKLDRELHLFN